MSSLISPQLLIRRSTLLLRVPRRYQRGPFTNKLKRSFAERNRLTLTAHQWKRLQLAKFKDDLPMQYEIEPLPVEPTLVKNERKLPSMKDSALPYEKLSAKEIEERQDLGTYFDPLFNPHLHEERNRVNPDEEPFNAIYTDSTSEAAQEYTKVRNITTPELWEYVERLARIKVAPVPELRKAGEEVYALPSGFVPPPETYPDLPYFVPRTRNYLLPVYYFVNKDPTQNMTVIKQVSGELWKLEEDLRTHLEKISGSKKRILSAVLETDAMVTFRGRHVHQVVEWLYAQGF